MITTKPGAKPQFVASDHPRWDAYVRQHPQGSIFHTSAMIRAFAATKSLEPHAFAALDAAGNIVAMLVSVHVKTLPEFNSLASRVVHFAEPLCEPNEAGVAALTHLLAAHDAALRSRAVMCEIRCTCQPGLEKQAMLNNGYEHRDYINYLVGLQSDHDPLWKKLNKRMRQKIRGTQRKQVVVRDDNTPAGVRRLYQLLQVSYGLAKVPLVGRDLFENTLIHLPPECVRLRTAFQDERPIASIISLTFGDRVFSWYGGTLRLNGLSPFACIVWDDIVWGCQNGFRHYDFGGAGWPHEEYGPRKFKADFGGQEVRYGRYILPYSKVRLRIAEMAYKMSQRLGAWS